MGVLGQMIIPRNIGRIEDLTLDGRRMFLRVDLDCPMDEDGHIIDETKIQNILPTLRHAIAEGAKVVLATSIGEPGHQRDPRLSTANVGARLAEILDKEIYLPEDVVGDGPRKVILERVEGEVVLLENLFFLPEELSGDDMLGQRMAQLADVYVNEAFGLVNKRLTSTTILAKLFYEKGAGFRFQKELKALGRLASGIEKPFVVVSGGTNPERKLRYLNSILGTMESILVGGEIATTFLAAGGHAVGCSTLNSDILEEASKFLSRAELRDVNVVLPRDVVVAPNCGKGAAQIVPVTTIPDGSKILDIGPETVSMFAERVAKARTVFWEGTMGAIENEDGRPSGTLGVGKAIARSSALSIVGGADTATAVGKLVLTPFLSHVSCGGDAVLDLIEGLELPGLSAMREGD